MNEFLCPVCRGKLMRAEHAYSCPKGHSFDRAKSGYVNLLLPGDKHSKAPGDNKLMVDARQSFLNKGYYQPLCAAVGEGLVRALKKREAGREIVLLDAGCGEGYYTAAVRQALTEEGFLFRLYGIDISKWALDMAARRDKAVEYAVASVFHLPVGDASCHVLLNLFAPYCAGEVQRVVKPGGLLLLVIPGERHLMELKEAVYDTPYANEVKDYELEGFTMQSLREVDYPLVLPCADDILHLFQMTPYYYKTGRENQRRLEALESLTVTASFQVLVYERKSGR